MLALCWLSPSFSSFIVVLSPPYFWLCTFQQLDSTWHHSAPWFLAPLFILCLSFSRICSFSVPKVSSTYQHYIISTPMIVLPTFQHLYIFPTLSRHLYIQSPRHSSIIFCSLPAVPRQLQSRSHHFYPCTVVREASGPARSVLMPRWGRAANNHGVSLNNNPRCTYSQTSKWVSLRPGSHYFFLTDPWTLMTSIGHPRNSGSASRRRQDSVHP